VDADPDFLALAGVTVIGARGFLGSRICQALQRRGIPVRAVGREPLPELPTDLGAVVYCAGRAGDFLDDPADTVDGHAGLLVRLLARHSLARLVYVSSTRLYRNSPTTDEDALIPVDPSDPGAVYDLAKLLGENFTRTQALGRGVVARVSTIIDPDFRSRSLLRSFHDAAAAGGDLRLRTPPEACRDLIDVDDVVAAILGLASSLEASGTFNVASGVNVSNERIAAIFGRFRDFRVDYSEAESGYRAPARIDVTKLTKTLGFRPADPAAALERRLATFFSS
jgi:nucleoside-diphosphate-sugar epimerase